MHCLQILPSLVIEEKGPGSFVETIFKTCQDATSCQVWLSKQTDLAGVAYLFHKTCQVFHLIVTY